MKTKAYRRVEEAVEERYASHPTPDKPLGSAQAAFHHVFGAGAVWGVVTNYKKQAKIAESPFYDAG